MGKFTFSIFAFATLFTLTANAQDSIDADSMIIHINDVEVMSSYARREIDKPVVLSTVKSNEILRKLSNQEFPEIMKYTPSIYATKMGGGFGDARMTLRGFGSENISVLINGVPINGMENGSFVLVKLVGACRCGE